MTAIVVPFRGVTGKQRLEPAPEDVRSELALAMLADVLEACRAVGDPVLVTSDEAGEALAAELGAAVVPDPGSGQGAAVGVAVRRLEPQTVLVVNSDLPCATPRDLLTLLGAMPAGGIALVRAFDGTTNALALAAPRLFAPLYGSESARRFREHGGRLEVDVAVAEIPNLVDDVDTLADLERFGERVGPRTRAALDAVSLSAAS